MPAVEIDPLAKVAELVGMRGGPFTQAVVTAAGESLRLECHWHIAPQIEQTARVRTGRAVTAWLPTLALDQVLKVVDVVTGHEVTQRWWTVPGYGIESATPWPDLIDVTMRHGFEEVPPGLLPVIAGRALDSASGRVRQESIGGRGMTLESGADPVAQTVVKALTLPWRP